MSVPHLRKLSPLSWGLLAGMALGMALPGAARAQGVSNGVPTVVGNEAGEPVIQYGEGATPGINSGIYNMGGGSEGGARVTVGPGSYGSIANGGSPVFMPGGGGEVTYLAQSAPPASAPKMVVSNPAPVPAHRAFPDGARRDLALAESALEHNRLADAEAHIEAAQTILLNDREEGEQGWSQPVQQLESALVALRHHDAHQAREVVLPLSRQG